MIYIVDNISNYFIYLFIIHFGFRLNPRKNKFFIGASVLTMLSAGAYNVYFDTNSPIIYILWSVLSICLFFEDRLWHLFILSAALMYFTGIIDTFSVMLIQVVLIGRGVGGTGITWWMEPAYLLSFLVYLLIYLRLFKKNDIYLSDIKFKYKFALLIQASIFQMFYDYVFYFFDENHARYGLDAYAVFFISIAGTLYSIFLTLNLAIKNILSDRQSRELQSFMYMQKQQYDYQLQQSVAVRRFKHDLVNHIGVVRELINEMFDITTLLGNILQNAFEAAIKADVPRIRVELVEHKEEIFIVVSNSVAKRINTKTDFFMTFKKDRENHGFGEKIFDKLKRADCTSALQIPGNRPYKKAGGAGLVPKADKRCTGCGLCAKNCPAQAISKANLKTADSKKCISCMRCVTECPESARKVNEAMVSIAALAMKKACSERKSNELYI